MTRTAAFRWAPEAMRRRDLLCAASLVLAGA